MASGDTLLIFVPQGNEPPTSNPAIIDTRNNHPVLNFDDTTNKDAIFSAVMPRHYAGTTGVTVYLHWSANASTGDVDWDVAFERIGDEVQDIDSDGFFTANSSDDNTVPAAQGHISISNVTFTDGADMDSVAVGEGFRIKVTRDAASDTASGNVELRFVEIKET